jgi:hypothetical protein
MDTGGALGESTRRLATPRLTDRGKICQSCFEPLDTELMHAESGRPDCATRRRQATRPDARDAMRSLGFEPQATSTHAVASGVVDIHGQQWSMVLVRAGTASSVAVPKSKPSEELKLPMEEAAGYPTNEDVAIWALLAVVFACGAALIGATFWGMF